MVIFTTGNNQVIARHKETGIPLWSTVVPSVAQTVGIGGREMILRRNTIVVPILRNTVGLDVTTGAVRWSYSAPLDTIDDPEPIPGSVEGTHIDADSSLVFIPASGATISAVDAETGLLAWVWRVDGTLPHRSGSQGVTVSGDTVFATVWHFLDRQGLDAEAWLLALDRATGRELWKTVLPTRGPGLRAGTAPVLYGNLAIVMLMGGDEFAIDRSTQDIVWESRSNSIAAAYTSPVLHADLVFSDGGDGFVYARKAATGAVQWKTPFSQVSEDMLVTDRYVYAVNGGIMRIYNRGTGRKVAEITQPRTTNVLFSSAAVHENGNVYVTVNGAAWSFREP